MHGRLKVKTTAEQQEEKRKEREKKLKLFQKGCEKIQEKRLRKEYDEEALTVLAGLLQANPDYYTLWNFRKEIFLHAQKTKTEDEFIAMCKDDMFLTECCLRKNPKSYGAWHHRLWILKITPKVQWQKEILLCNKFLELDERNFHIWDRRRTICQIAEINPSEELDFTMKKIEENFSNYSAWHYRSSLLPLVHPNRDKKTLHQSSVDENVLVKEYELVQNAAFTDPSDQSAWFYHRWLLGRGTKKLSILYCFASLSKNSLIVAFTEAVMLGDNCVLELQLDDKKINCQWKQATINCSYPSTVWVCNGFPTGVSDKSLIRLTFNDNGQVKDQLEFQMKSEVLKWKDISRKSLYSSELSSVTEDVLKKELESCQQLMELEPDNKWTILTTVLLMQAINSQKYESHIVENLDKLVSVDPTRKNYYEDLRSKYLVENAIELLKETQFTLNLAKKELSLVPHLDHLTMLEELDISGNRIASFRNFGALICLSRLVADGNEIRDCSGLESLRYLINVSLKNNYVTALKDFQCLRLCKELKTLNLHGNPICLRTDIQTLVLKEVPGVAVHFIDV